MDEIIFGRGAHATWAIEDPSLDAVHARLLREGASYRLIDNGSTAGTWVNYEHTAPDGTILKNGDLIHIGQIRFRFTHRDSGQARKINIQPQEFTP
jgi:pSer/pThr/pTyr-binding forkhead associated (FHA) protein